MSNTTTHPKEGAASGALLFISSTATRGIPRWAADEWLHHERKVVLARAYRDGVTNDDLDVWIFHDIPPHSAKDRRTRLLEFVNERSITRLYVPRAAFRHHTTEQVRDTQRELRAAGTELIFCDE